MEKLAAAEENLTVVCDTHVYGVEMSNDETIESVLAMNILTLAKFRFTGKIFIDCTGDGWVGYFAGAKSRFGREGFLQHEEGAAPTICGTVSRHGMRCCWWFWAFMIT